jgi:hypothetical protein
MPRDVVGVVAGLTPAARAAHVTGEIGALRIQVRPLFVFPEAAARSGVEIASEPLTVAERRKGGTGSVAATTLDGGLASGLHVERRKA